MNTLCRIALALSCVCLMSAETTKAPVAAAHQRPATPVAKASAKPVLNDAAIEQQIRARFAKSKISADKFQLKVQGGVAYIDGKTEVMQHKGVATRMAKSGGAIQVVNKVQISEAARQKAVANLDKGRRREQIKRSEVAHR